MNACILAILYRGNIGFHYLERYISKLSLYRMAYIANTYIGLYKLLLGIKIGLQINKSSVTCIFKIYISAIFFVTKIKKKQKQKPIIDD